MKRKAEMEEGSLFSQTDMTPKGTENTKIEPLLFAFGVPGTGKIRKKFHIASP